MIRSAAVAGQFYEGTYDGLLRQIEGLMDYSRPKTPALGMVCPHAGLMYSGRVQAAAYSSIEPADTYVILGPNHRGIGSDFSMMTRGAWDTPVGRVDIDEDLACELFKSQAILSDEPMAHFGEHSIEVQLPFIKYLDSKSMIVPIMFKHYQPDESYLKACQEMGKSLARASAKFRHRVTVVASTDLSHYVPQDKSKVDDESIMQSIDAMDPRALFDTVSEKDISMCGWGPVAAMLFACIEMGAKRSVRISYDDSGFAMKDKSSVVGYASHIIV